MKVRSSGWFHWRPHFYLFFPLCPGNSWDGKRTEFVCDTNTFYFFFQRLRLRNKKGQKHYVKCKGRGWGLEITTSEKQVTDAEMKEDVTEDIQWIYLSDTERKFPNSQFELTLLLSDVVNWIKVKRVTRGRGTLWCVCLSRDMNAKWMQ